MSRKSSFKPIIRILSCAIIVSFLLEQICWAGTTDIGTNVNTANSLSGNMPPSSLNKSQTSAQGLVDAKNAVIVMSAAVPVQADQVNFSSSSAVTYYSQGYNDIIADFGPSGMWKYTNNKWNLISYLNADSFTLSPLNNGTYDVIADFGPSGMWKYSNNQWNLLSYLNADSFTISPLTNNTYEIIGDFGPSGMWKYTNNKWNQISQLDVESYSLSPLNNNTYDIIGDFF